MDTRQADRENCFSMFDISLPRFVVYKSRSLLRHGRCSSLQQTDGNIAMRCLAKALSSAEE